MDKDTAVLMLGEGDAWEDPSSLIVDATGHYENCVFIPLVKHAHAAGSESESDTDFASSCKSEFVPIGPSRCSFCFEFESTLYSLPSRSLLMK